MMPAAPKYRPGFAATSEKPDPPACAQAGPPGRAAASCTVPIHAPGRDRRELNCSHNAFNFPNVNPRDRCRHRQAGTARVQPGLSRVRERRRNANTTRATAMVPSWFARGRLAYRKRGMKRLATWCAFVFAWEWRMPG